MWKAALVTMLLVPLGCSTGQGAADADPSDDQAGGVGLPADDADPSRPSGSGTTDQTPRDDGGDGPSDPGGDTTGNDATEDSGAGSSDGNVDPGDAGSDSGAGTDMGTDTGTDPNSGSASDGDNPDGGTDGGSEPASPQAIPAELVAIVDDIPGWAAGTVGGRDGSLYTITTLARTGPGSISEALESAAPLWIVFAEGLNGTIILDGEIVVHSFKTLDARGHNITLKAGNSQWSTGIKLGAQNEAGVEHVVFLNLTFDGSWPNYREDSEGDDGLNIRNGSHHVWVHQCSFTNWVDGAIDAKRDVGFDLPHHVSITNSVFTKTHQPLAVGVEYLTFARNHCTDVSKRCIQLNDGGRAHMINNVIENWRSVEIIAARDGAQLLVDHNIFKPGPDRDSAGVTFSEDTDVEGRWQNERNHRSGGWVAFTAATSVDTSFFDEARATYAPEQCGILDFGCWDALYEDVVANAGARP